MDNPSILVIACETQTQFDEIIKRAGAFFTGDTTIQVYAAINDVAASVIALVTSEGANIVTPAPPVPRTAVEHARVELAKIGESPATIDGYAAVLQAFVNMDHSGPYDADSIAMITKLLQTQPLSPLTDDPGEWVIFPHEGDLGNVRQNIRNLDALSTDGGKTYYLASDGPGGPIYTSANYVFKPA